MRTIVATRDVLRVIDSAIESYRESAEYVEREFEVAQRDGIAEDACACGIDLERINACIRELQNIRDEVCEL